MYKDKINLLGTDIKRGEHVTLEMEIAKLHNRSSVKIPIIIERSKKDGPVVLFMAGVHGDEINGVEIVRRIIKEKINKTAMGTVICIPVFNVFGFLNLSREFPDGRDLNRVFPGSANGSLASQFAHQFMKSIVPIVDYVFDYHTGGAARVNASQIRCDISDEKSIELAKAFGADFIVNSKSIPKSIRYTLKKHNISALLYEGGMAKNFDEHIIQSGFDGAKNVLRFLKMRTGPKATDNKSVLVKKSKWIRAPYSGMFHVKIKNGQWITKKTVLGIITDPYAEFEKKIVAPIDCYVFCVNNFPIVNRGDAIFHVSLEAE
ncbi:MAG: succinylglutamate desuccinylase/aspartoacylase family protein [Candidatus Kapabacteria bacterium]|jgi:predicted deacylase|nr:succinylglutamate desuccinylase/aspartoacylase family protein [Candidatus Kapabacteria bacterium]